MDRIKIYTTGPQCAHCNALKAACHKEQIEYDEKPLDSNAITEYTLARDQFIAAAPIVLVKRTIESGKYNMAYEELNWFGPDDLFDQAGNLLTNWRNVLDGGRPEIKQFSGTASNEGKEQRCRKIWG